MSQDAVTDHYVLILNIEKITKTSTDVYAMGRRSGTEEKRDKHEIAKIVVKDQSLGRLLEKAKKHIDLVTDEGADGKASS